MDLLRAALRKNSSVTLDVAALEMAAIEHPGLVIDPYLSALDGIANGIAARLRDQKDGRHFIETANHCLFEGLGLRGNEAHYYDPRNSCVNDVLDRKLGIPITLSLVYMEVARRLRRPVFGIGLPGHFILQYDDDSYSTFIDPYHGGKLLSTGDCRQLAKDIAGVELAADPSLLRPVSNQHILTRMLNNLRSAYFRGNDYRKAVQVLDLLIEASPAADHFKARGVAHMHLRELLAARADFDLYLQHSPEAVDRAEIAKQLESIHRWLASVN